MIFERLAFIFEVMIYVGLGLPLLNVLIGFLGGLGSSGPDVGGDLSADAPGDLDALGDVDIDLDIDADIGDAGDLDLDGIDAGDAPQGIFIRFNMYCLCLALVVMGALGLYTVTNLGGILRIIGVAGSAVLAFAAYVLVYRFVFYPLKRNDPRALNAKTLKFAHAIVISPITHENPGKIQTVDAVGAVISYLARIDEDICPLKRIEEGEEVIITEVDGSKGICSVYPARYKVLKKNGGK